MQPVGAAAQQPDGVDPGHGEAGDHVGRQQHVDRLVPEGAVEEHAHGSDVDDPPVAQGEAGGLVHPAVGGDDRQRAAEARRRPRHAGPEVRPRAHAVPAVDVDRDEDRLEEEEQPLDREWDAEGCAEAAHQPGPQQAQLEREHGPGHRPDGEEDGGDLRPAAGQHERLLVALAQPAPVGDEHQERERDAERHQDDVEAQRERHLLARGQQLRGVARRCEQRPADRVEQVRHGPSLLPPRRRRTPTSYGHAAGVRRSRPDGAGEAATDAVVPTGGDRVRAMTYRGPYKVRVEEKDRPRIEHPNDAIVRVTLAAICGSDLHLYHGLMPDTRVGHTFGHEFIGVVEEVGSSVQNLQVGDRVMVPFNVFCGSCFFCARGLYSNCHNVNPNATAVGGIYGYSHTCGGYDGGQAEYVRVPFADVGPAKIPDWMEDEDAVLLTDALSTGYFGAQLGDIVEGDVVVVLGAGPVGLFAARSAWLMGAGRVIVVDHLDYRLEKARAFAYAETINFAEHDDLVVLLKRMTDHLGADVVIDAVGAEADGNLIQHVTSAKLKLQGGSPVALNWAIDAVHKGGTVSVMGAYGPLFSAVKFGDAMNKGLTPRMNQCPVKRQWPRLFEHIRNGYLKPSDIVTHRIPLEHIAEGYHIFSSKLDGCIKPLIVPNAS